MYQAIDIFLDMLKENNEVVKYISKNKDLSTAELVNRLFDLFPTIGYGDSQYIELINKAKWTKKNYIQKLQLVTSRWTVSEVNAVFSEK